MKTSYLYLLLLLIFSFVSYGQTGPGGVGSQSSNPMWYDANRLTGYSNNAPVSSWIDLSGNNNNASQGSSTRRPLYIANSLNGKASLLFDGTDYLQTSSITGLNTNQLYWILVAKTNNTTVTDYFLSSAYGTPSNFIWGTFFEANNQYRSFGQSSTNAYKAVNHGSPSGFNILSANWLGNTGTLNGYVNGTLSSTATGVNKVPSGHIFSRIGSRTDGGTTGTFLLQGNIAEIIAFSYNPSSAERIIVDSYLGAKYGLTVTNDKFAFDATHGEEVAGIGKEADGANTTARGTGIVTVTNNSLSNGQYFLFGHNNIALTATQSIDVPASGALRLSRTWRASNTGNVGSVDVSFNLTGITFGDPTDYRLLIDADGVFSNATEVTSGMSYNAATNTLSFTGVSIPDGSYFTLATGAIVSVATGNWNTASTWSCNCVPTTSNNVKINNPHVVTANSNAGVDSLTILNGGTLLITNNAVFTVMGGIANNGSFTGSGSSEVVLASTASQPLSGSGVYDFFSLTLNNSAKSINQVLDVNGNLTLNNPATLDLNGFDVHLAGNLTSTTATPFIDNTGTFVFNGFPPQSANVTGTVAFFNVSADNVTTVDLAGGSYTVSGALEVKNGSTLNANGRLTILSDATRTGIIGQVNGAITGSVTVQRFLSGRDSGYVELSSPVQNSTIADWDAELYMYGVGGPDGSGPSTATTVYTYSESLWDYVRVSSTATALTPGKGFDVYLTTNTGTLGAFQGATLTTGGTPNQGTISLSPPSITNVNDGWNLVGNPYAAFINWSTVLSASTNIAANYQIYDDQIRNFRTFGAGTEIAPGHGFWIEATGNPTLTFTEPSKTFSANSIFMRRQDPFAGIKVTLTNDEDPYAHIFKVEINKDASSERDDFDATYLRSRDPRSPHITTTLSDGRKLVLTSVPAEEEIRIPLQIYTGRTGIFKLNVDGTTNYPGYHTYLIDYKSNTKVKVKDNKEFTFDASSVHINERFELLLTKDDSGIDAVSASTPVIIERNNGVYFVTMDNVADEFATVTVRNTLGQLISETKTIVKGDRMQLVVPDATQVYVVTMTTASGKTIHSKVAPF